MSTGTLQERLQTALGSAYTVEYELGGGGMSRVFVAEEKALGRRVVVKVLPPELAHAVSAERFRQEIRLAARLQHPHIVPLHSAGEADGLLYYTMPLVEGESLRARLARGGELPVREAIRVLRDVAAALTYAHEHGLVHRDIKPDNVLISGGEALVTDFGVAKALSAAATGESSGLTSLGVALGTPAYMAPEQAAADPQTDHRADLYAWGCLAYECLTGQPPFTGRQAAALLAAHMAERPEAIERRRPALPPALSALVMRCLEKRPSDRPQSAAEVHGQLELIATPSGGSAPTTVAAAVPRPASRRWVPVAAGLAGLAVVVGAGYWSLERRAPPDRHRVLAPVFVNKSGNDAFAPVIANAAAAVSSALAEIEGVEVVDGPGSRATAGTVVRGTLYRQGDSIQLSATIADASSGKTYYTVGPVEAPVTRPGVAIQPLVQRIVGGVAITLDPSWGVPGALPARAPRWDAYRTYVRADVAFYRENVDSAYLLFMRAAALDSTFSLARLRAVNTLINGGSPYIARAESALAAAEQLRPDLSPFEAQYLNMLRGWARGDWESARTAALELTRLAPASGIVWFLRGAFANVTRRWHESVSVLEKLNPRDESLRIRPSYYFFLTNALHMLGEHSRELAAARRGRQQFPEILYIRQLEVRALAALGRSDELNARLSDALTLPADWRRSPGDMLLGAVVELRAHGSSDASAAMLRGLLDWLVARPSADAKSEPIRQLRGEALTLAQRWPEAQAIADSLGAEHPEDPTYLGMRGLIAAHRGDTAVAEDFAAQLAALTSTQSGWTTYLRAEIAAVLGQVQKAIALLRDAMAQGATQVSFTDDDPALEQLRAVPEYRALVAPRD